MSSSQGTLIQRWNKGCTLTVALLATLLHLAAFALAMAFLRASSSSRRRISSSRSLRSPPICDSSSCSRVRASSDAMSWHGCGLRDGDLRPLCEDGPASLKPDGANACLVLDDQVALVPAERVGRLTKLARALPLLAHAEQRSAAVQ